MKILYDIDLQPYFEHVDHANPITKEENPFEQFENDELHLVAHGSPGHLYLGTGINTPSLSKHAKYLSAIEKIVIWGCHVGQDTEFIETLREITKAEIYASQDVLGKNKGMDGFPRMNEIITNLPFYLGQYKDVNGVWMDIRISTHTLHYHLFGGGSHPYKDLSLIHI